MLNETATVCVGPSRKGRLLDVVRDFGIRSCVIDIDIVFIYIDVGCQWQPLIQRVPCCHKPRILHVPSTGQIGIKEIPSLFCVCVSTAKFSGVCHCSNGATSVFRVFCHAGPDNFVDQFCVDKSANSNVPLHNANYLYWKPSISQAQRGSCCNHHYLPPHAPPPLLLPLLLPPLLLPLPTVRFTTYCQLLLQNLILWATATNVNVRILYP